MSDNINVCFYRHVLSNEPHVMETMDYDSLCNTLQHRWAGKDFAYVNEKPQAPLWSPVSLSFPKRTDKNVVRVSLLVLDFDESALAKPSIETLREVFGGWAGFSHTTKRHTEDNPRARIVLRLSEDVDVKTFKKLWKWAEKYSSDAGLVIDPACKDASRMYFVPFSTFTWEQWDGPALDVASVISGVVTARPVDTQWEINGDTIIRTPDLTTTVEQWARKSKPGDKLKCYCPRVEESTLGSAFLRRTKAGAIFVCMSPNHGHESPLKGWWHDETAGNRRPPIPADIVNELEWKLDGQGNRTNVAPTLNNLVVILQRDPEWANRFWFNLYTNAYMIDERLLEDNDVTIMRARVEVVYRVRYTKAEAFDVVNRVCRIAEKDPLLEELNSFAWDGEDRLKYWVVRGLGCEDSPLYQEFGMKWLIQAIARAYNPGCKADATLLLQGDQGARKGSALKALIGQAWYSETPLNIGTRQAFVQLSRAWVHELAELETMRLRESTSVKAFLTPTEDMFVPPYGRYAVVNKRRCVFTGTTNEAEFLTDHTGSRRFWIIPCGEIDIEWVAENRSQLLAEAIVRYKRGESWWLDKAAEVAREEMAQEYQHTDSWEELIAAYLFRNNFKVVTVAQILTDCLDINACSQNRGHQTRVGIVLQVQKWKKRRVSVGAIRPWVWVAPNTDPAEIEAWAAGGSAVQGPWADVSEMTKEAAQ